MSVPNHIAVIPDGNRRWAKAKNLNPENPRAYFLMGQNLFAVKFFVDEGKVIEH